MMSVSTSSDHKSLYSGPPTMAPPGKLYNQEVGGDGEQQLRQRRTGGAASPNDLGGAASPLELSGVASPASVSPADPGVGASPAPLRGIPIVSPADEQQEEKVVVALASAEMRRRVFETCIFVLSAAIILVFIGMLLFVLAFNEEITKVIEKTIDIKPKLRDLYCNTKLCKSFTREVISYVNFSRDPCNEFYEYVCEGYMQEALTDRFKWTAPGLDNARLSKVLDGIYHRNVSDGPVWERRFMPENLWELASPLYDRCLRGDAAAVTLPYDLNTYFEDSVYNLSADLVEAYKVIPLVHLVMTTAFPWDAERNYSVPTLETARLRALMDTDYVTTKSGERYMTRFIHDLWNGVTPNNKITWIEGPLQEEIAAYVRNYWRYTLQGRIRVMFPQGLVVLKRSIANGTKPTKEYKKARQLEWLHVAARLALAMGSEPAASAAVTLMAGVSGKAHGERRCLTLFDTEARPFAFDRVRAILHTDETAAMVKKLQAQFREYLRKFAYNGTFGGSSVQERLTSRVDTIGVLFMYPFSDYTDAEVGQYPLTRLVFTLPDPVSVPQNASFWEHLRLVKEAIFEVGMRDDFNNYNLSFQHFSPFEYEPHFAWHTGTLYIPPLFYQKLSTMTDAKDEEGIPLDLPVFWYIALRQILTILSHRGSLYEKNGQHRLSLGFTSDRLWASGRPCMDAVLSRIGAHASDEEYDYLQGDPYLVTFLYQLFLSKTDSWRKKNKPGAEKVFLHDNPEITLDKLFAIALGSNFCRKEDRHLKRFYRERPPNLSQKQWLMYLILTWLKFREIFNCTATDKYVLDGHKPCYPY